VICYFKMDIDATPVELMYLYAMLAGTVIPLALVRGITINSYMDHRRMNFCKPKAKKSLSDF
jgi:hypothetical protein